MEECHICFIEFESPLEILPCLHKLCKQCYLRLVKPLCPFCRYEFSYNNEDEQKRNNHIQYIRQRQPPYYPNIRLERNRYRKRRRNLTLDEIILRRKNIRSRCKKKWLHKNKNLIKKWWLIQ